MIEFRKIEIGLELLFMSDWYLLKNNINERSITHKLAEHLQKSFIEWNVDCEFNRNLNRPKIVDINPSELLGEMANYLEGHYPEKKRQIDEMISAEERENLTKQLRKPNIEYIEELDLYLFLLKIGKKVLKQTIFPDIIIHRRGTSQNHIVIEAKKTQNKNREARLYDLLKLATMTAPGGQFGYCRGIFMDLPVGSDLTRFHGFHRKKAAFRNVFEYLPI
jgi:hypothetical protein